jgi:hypothetical protein
VRHDLTAESFDALKPIAGNWPGLPAAWLSGARTALSWHDNAVYFLRDAQYLKYNLRSDSAGPIKPIAGNWHGLPAAWAASGVDAAVNWGNGKVYFFKGGEYLRYDIATDRADDNYPRPLTPRWWPNWPAAWTSGIDAGVALKSGKAYLFKGREYLRYDIVRDRVDEGYPLPIAGHWPGLPNVFSSGIDAVIRAPGEDLTVDYFYGDLDGDGLAEVATSRILGSPAAMLRQLGTTAGPTTPHALILNAEPRGHMEANQIATTLAGRGSTFEAIERADVSALTRADVIFHHGHGNPDGWYGTEAGAYVTAATVPELPRRPVIFAGACSTATPGAPILRAFMDKGCRSYVGAVSDAYGMTTGLLGNELFLHFVDALRAHPDWTMAELVREARMQYVRVNRLAPLLLQLEKGEYPSVTDDLVHTALQMQVFGDITAKIPQAQLSSIVARFALARGPVTLKAGGTIPLGYEIRPSDGLATLSLRAEWDEDVSANLDIEIVQNGNLLHRLDWKEQREYWAYSDTRLGGYSDGRRYQALALAPLARRAGANEMVVRVARASKPVRILAESEVQVWPRRSVKLPNQLTPRTVFGQILFNGSRAKLATAQRPLGCKQRPLSRTLSICGRSIFCVREPRLRTRIGDGNR